MTPRSLSSEVRRKTYSVMQVKKVALADLGFKLCPFLPFFLDMIAA